MDLRYSYQAYELTIPISSEEVSYDGLASIVDRFHRAHQSVYGHHSPRQLVQLVSLRVVAVGKLPRNYVASTVADRNATLDEARIGERQVYFRETGLTPCPVYERASLPAGTPIRGPAILEEPSSTVVVYPGQQAEATTHGTLTITNA